MLPLSDLIKNGKVSLELFNLICWLVLANKVQSTYANISLLLAFILLPFMLRIYQSGELELAENSPKTQPDFFKQIGKMMRKPKFLIIGLMNNLLFIWTMFYLLNLMLFGWSNAEYFVFKILFLIGISTTTYYFIAPIVLQRDKIKMSVSEIIKKEVPPKS